MRPLILFAFQVDCLTQIIVTSAIEFEGDGADFASELSSLLTLSPDGIVSRAQAGEILVRLIADITAKGSDLLLARPSRQTIQRFSDEGMKMKRGQSQLRDQPS
nr:hypothetical protein [Rhodopirellula sp. MGV]